MIPEDSQNVQPPAGDDAPRRVFLGMDMASPPGCDQTSIVFTDEQGRFLGGIKNIGADAPLPMGEVTGFTPMPPPEEFSVMKTTRWGSQDIKRTAYQLMYDADIDKLDPVLVDPVLVDKAQEKMREVTRAYFEKAFAGTETTTDTLDLETLTIDKMLADIKMIMEKQARDDEKLIKALLDLNCDIRLEGTGERITVTLPVARYAKAYARVKAKVSYRLYDPYDPHRNPWWSSGSML